MFKLLAKVLLLVFCAITVGFAQSNNVSVDSADIKKSYNPWAIYSSLRGEKIFDKGSSLYGEYSYIFPEEYGSLNEVYRSFLWIGYEQAFTEKWHGGISERVNFVDAGGGSFFTRFNFSHRGTIGKFFFYKEVSFEHLKYVKNASYQRPAEGRFSPSMGLGRIFSVAKRSLYVGVNYRFFLNFDFKNDNTSAYASRKIDRTKLRFDIAYQVLPHWSLGIYYLRDTDYYYSLASYNGANQVIVPEYKVNQITQGVGVVLTYLLFKEKPDTYIPGLLPSR